MALYDVPIHSGYKVLTHPAGGRYAKNGLKQVGNELVPAHNLTPTPVKKSSIYNKNLSGVSEAGYGRRYPYHGLSYAGAGSPRTSLLRGLAYAGAGSPRTSLLKGLAYAGAGSPRTSILAGLRYAGAGSPRTSLLKDAYINDNPPPGTLHGLAIRYPLRGLRGLADDAVPQPGDPGFIGPTLPGTAVDTSGGYISSLESVWNSIFSSTLQAGTQAANTSIYDAITGAATPTTTAQKAAVALSTATNPTTILGLSVDTALLIGGGVLAFLYLRKK